MVYFLFGGVGWYMGDASFTDILTCFVLGSVHLGGGSWMLIASLRDYRRERRRVDAIIRHLIKSNGGRVVVSELASFAEISEDDARDYLEKRSTSDVAFVTEGRNGHDVYYFSPQFWYN